MKIEIKHRWSGEVLFECDAASIKAAVHLAIEAKANLAWADLSKANLAWANLAEANLAWADLSKADLSKANLSKANLSKANLAEANLAEANLAWANLAWANLAWADLSKADLSKADLSKANLSEANLSEANLAEANLAEANLAEANLAWANLRPIKHDVWGVLLMNKAEVPFLRQALIDGKIDGSTYTGECACLCGTLAHAKGIQDGGELSIADASSLSERFFLAIRKGETPDTNQCAKLALDWIDEFLELTK